MAWLGTLGKVLVILGLGVAPGLVLYAFVEMDKVASWIADAWRSRRAGPEPLGPPVERLAADLRRLSAVMRSPGPVSSVRRLGVERAYDETLVRAAESLAIPTELEATTGWDRDLERLRLETQLERAGLVLRNPDHHHDRG
jgi:hypothetical protein